MDNRITVTFMHPTCAQDTEVELEDSLSASTVIDELVSADFIPDNGWRGGYALYVRDSEKMISGTETLASGGARNGSSIRILIPTTPG